MGTGRRYKVATVAGIPIYVATSWVFIAGLYLYAQYLRLENSFPPPSQSTALALAVFGAALFFGGVLVHEGAHAVMARAPRTCRSRGITLVFWGGATETKASARGPLGEFLVAFVGPASTLALAGVFWVVARQRPRASSARSLSTSRASACCSPASTRSPGSRSTADGCCSRPPGASRGAVGRRSAWPATSARSRRRVMAFAAYTFVTSSRTGTRLASVPGLPGVHPDHRGTRHGPADRSCATSWVSARRPTRCGRRRRPCRRRCRSPRRSTTYLRVSRRPTFPVVDAGRVVGTVSLEQRRKLGARDPTAAGARRDDPGAAVADRVARTRPSTTRSSGWRARGPGAARRRPRGGDRAPGRGALVPRSLATRA